MYPKIKRLLDVVMVLGSLVFLAPLILLIALSIYLESGGPVFYRTVRIGKGSRPFFAYKFRTIRVAPKVEHEAYLEKITSGTLRGPGGDPVAKLKQDPRLTRVGRFLRLAYLDELPQYFNVLQGDMSLVGPRPAQPFEMDRYTERERERFAVLPGITGLAQVHAKRGMSRDEWIKLDLEYMRRQSLALDLEIMLRTVVVVINGEGAV